MHEISFADYEQAVLFGEDILVFRRCPKCGRYLRIAPDACVVETAAAGVTEFRGFECARCGEVKPAWERAAWEVGLCER